MKFLLYQEIHSCTNSEESYYFIVYQIIPNGGETMGGIEIKRRIARTGRNRHTRQQNGTILSK